MVAPLRVFTCSSRDTRAPIDVGPTWQLAMSLYAHLKSYGQCKLLLLAAGWFCNVVRCHNGNLHCSLLCKRRHCG